MAMSALMAIAMDGPMEFLLAERRAQLPRARVELSGERGQRGKPVVKSGAGRLGVSCSVLFGCIWWQQST